MLPRINSDDFNDLADILATWFKGHDLRELDSLVTTVKTRLALDASKVEQSELVEMSA